MYVSCGWLGALQVIKALDAEFGVVKHDESHAVAEAAAVAASSTSLGMKPLEIDTMSSTGGAPTPTGATQAELNKHHVGHTHTYMRG